MHHLKQTGLSLHRIEMVVYDEADRIFELGFEEHLKAITEKLPRSRQSLLFSATIPPSLAEFSLSGITDYKLLKLDQENTLSDQLSL